MNPTDTLQALRDRLPLPALGWRRRVAIQCIGLGDETIGTLRQALDTLSPMLAVELELRHRSGDILFVDSTVAGSHGPVPLSVVYGNRPVVAVSNAQVSAGTVATPWRISRALREAELLQTLRAIPLLREQARPSRRGDPLRDAAAAMPGWAPDEAATVRALLGGLVAPEQPPLVASYGPGATLEVDFAAGQVWIDPDAWERLCVGHELPVAVTHAAVGHAAEERELDRVVWAFGLACAQRPLLGSADDWQQRVLRAPRLLNIRRYTLKPTHLLLAKLLVEGDLTPAKLRLRSRVPEPDLREFLQACLFLGLTRWA